MRLQNGGIHNLVYSQNIIRFIESKRKKWTKHVACIGHLSIKKKDRKPKGKSPLERPRLRWKYNINPLTPNDPYMGRTAPLTSKRCILYMYSTNIDTECFKHNIYSPFFSLQNAVCLIILMYLIPVLFTFYIQGVLK